MIKSTRIYSLSFLCSNLHGLAPFLGNKKGTTLMVIKTNKTVPIILWIFLVWKTAPFLKKTLSKRAPAYNPAKWWQNSGSNLCSSTGIAYVIYCSNPEFEGGKKPGKGWCRRLTAYGIYTFFTIWRCHPDLNWGVELLQSSALPLGYVTITAIIICGLSEKVHTYFWDFNAHTVFSVWALNWSGQRGSNSLPPPWQGGALPDELCPQVVPRAGIEPATRGFSVHCSTNWATEA